MSSTGGRRPAPRGADFDKQGAADCQQSHHDDLVSLGQGNLVALGQVGEVPTPATLSRQPRWVWFMIWGDFVDTHNTPQQIKALYDHSGILTHEDFVAGK